LRRKRRKKKSNRGKRIAVFFSSLLVFIVAFFAIMGMGGLFSIENNQNQEIEFVKPDKETGKINVLVIGLDHDQTRTDTIMVASYDLDEDKVNILSIPRDTRMYVGGRYQKINCAYAVSKNGKKNGVNGTIEAVSRLTGIPINYYVEFTCEAFRDTIDALGGVDYDVPQNMNYEDPYQDLYIHLTKGQQHLDGDKAEQLVRFRKYPMGDIDRVKVQQNFLREIAKQKLTPKIIADVPKLFKVLQKDIKTNFTVGNVAKYAVNLSDLTAENISMYSIPGVADSESYGASYWVANMTELATLIEDTFGYDASKITIHSEDGTSISKDKKIVKTTETKKETENTDDQKTQTTTKTTTKTETKSETKQEKTENTVKPKTDTETKTDEVNRPKANENESTGIKRPKANPTDDEEE